MMDIELTIDSLDFETLCEALADNPEYHHALGELLWAAYKGNKLRLAQQLKLPGTTFVESIQRAKDHLAEWYLIDHPRKTKPAKVDAPPTPIKVLGRPGRRKKNAEARSNMA